MQNTNKTNIAYIDDRVGDATYGYYGSFFKSLQSIGADVHNFRDFSYEALKNYNIIIFGLGFFDRDVAAIRCDRIEELKCTKIAILHKVKNFYEGKLHFCKVNNINKILTTTPFSEKIQKDSNIPTFTLPYCADASIFRPMSDVEKIYDIGFSGALHAGKKLGCEGELFNIRVKIMNLLEARKDLNVFWNGTDASPQENRIHNTNEYAKKINECKVWLCVTGPSFDVNPRFHEVSLCRTLPLTNSIPCGFYDNFFKNKYNCISFANDISDFVDSLDYALLNYEKLADCAYKFALENSTLEARGKSLLDIIKY